MRTMLDQFTQNGWIKDPRPMLIWARLSGSGHRLKAGEYRFEYGIDIKESLDILTEGRSELRQITFIEGQTISQALDSLKKAEIVVDWDSQNELQRALGLEEYTSIEGLIFPDTYSYHRNMHAIDLLKISYTKLNDILNEEWQKRALLLPYKSAYEALILASIIEKESALKEEQPRVAGVLVRRLQKGIRLAADPTVIYGLGDRFDGNLRRKHLQDANNLYNTYKHTGLPPSPIALVSRSAIRAAMHPTEENALYFVARGDGSHVFSDTLEEHEHWVDIHQRH